MPTTGDFASRLPYGFAGRGEMRLDRGRQSLRIDARHPQRTTGRAPFDG